MASLFPPDSAPEVATLVDNVTHTTYSFPFNINSLNWNYNMNTQTTGTYGGRVVQILSINITTLSIQGEAGSRSNLITLFENFKAVQDSQNQFKVPMTFNVPSRNLTFSVYLEAFQMGWGVETVAYQYNMQLEVNQDVSNTSSNATAITATNALDRIAQGIGFSPYWDGLGSSAHNVQFQDIQNALQSGALTSTGFK
jgi:hypothetical protein